MQKRLHGKRALIIGGSRGIGAAIARAYLTEGAEVIIAARNKDELAKMKEQLVPLGPIATAVLDVTDRSAFEALVTVLKREDKPLDVLVNAAGIYGPIGLVDDIDPEKWLEAIKINLYGTFLAIHYSVPLMNPQRGVVINFVGGGEGAKPNFSSYVSAKGGIARLTETIAAELKPLNIDVNAIAPGAVNTKFLDEILAAGPEKAGKETYEASLKQKASGGTPPEKGAALAVWLASDASKGLTGKILSAVWDQYEQFSERMNEIMGSDVYTMRRVDGR